MRIIFAVAALFVLSGCETMEFTAVDYHHGYNYGPSIHTAGHISYTLGYYSGNYYNGYQVYGSHGHRYYHAPRNYSHHRHFSRPVVVQHVHVHTSYCEHNVRPRNNHRRDYAPPVVRNTPRHAPPRNDNRQHDNRRNDRRQAPPRTVPPRHTPPRQREPRADHNNRREVRADNRPQRENRQDKRRDKERKRK